MSITIKGTGYYLPKKIVTNDELAEIVDTNDEWIVRRVGIKERRIATCETTEYMAAEAAKNAIKSAGINANEIDLIIVSTITGEKTAATVAASVQSIIGAECPAFDVL